MNRYRFPGLAAAALCSALTVPAQSVAGLLQEALYAEETAGDFKSATALYEQVLATRTASVWEQARARYRLATIDLAEGRTDLATNRLNHILEQLPEDDVLLQNARRRLAELVPWTKRVVTWTDQDISNGTTPDGTKLFYVSWDWDSYANLGFMDLQTGDRQLITNNADLNQGAVAFAVASPEGERVAYRWENGDAIELRTIGIDGTNQRTLFSTSTGVWRGPYGWSATGQILIVLRSSDGTYEIAVIDAESGSARTLLSLGNRIPGSMDFSPDGRFVVYDLRPAPDVQQLDVFIVRADGTASEATRARVIVDHPATDYEVSWSPDGNWIVFCSDRLGRPALFRIRVSDGFAQGDAEYVTDANEYRKLGFTRSGALLYWTRRPEWDVYVAEFDSETPFRNERKVGIQYEGRNSKPAFSPNGESLAYVSYRGELNQPGANEAIVVRSLTTGEETVLEPELTIDDLYQEVHWFPDGVSLLVGGWNAEERLVPGWSPIGSPSSLYRVATPSGEVTRITDRAIQYATPSSDGGKLYGLNNGSVIEVDLETDQRRLLLAADAHAMSLSPDGRQIALVRNEYLSVFEISAPDTRRDLVRLSQEETEEFAIRWPPLWQPDSGQLWFTLSRGDGTRWLCRVPIAGGPFERVLEHSVNQIRLSQDGRRIAFARTEPTATILALENFLPLR